jgi:hypothetical protein
MIVLVELCSPYEWGVARWRRAETKVIAHSSLTRKGGIISALSWLSHLPGELRNKVSKALGDSQKNGQPNPDERAALVEPLEPRQMLSISISTVNGVADEQGQVHAQYAITRDGATSGTSSGSLGAATVYFSIGGGTADGDDLVTTSSAVFFATQSTGTSTIYLDVVPADDQLVEPTETFTVSLTSCSGDTIDTSQASGSIIDDDVNITIGAPGLTALTTGEIPVTVRDYYGNGKAMTLDVSGYDSEVLDPASDHVTTDFSGNGVLDVYCNDAATSGLVMQAPNGNQGNQNQAPVKPQVVILEDPISIWSGGKASFTVSIQDPNEGSGPIEGLKVQIPDEGGLTQDDATLPSTDAEGLATVHIKAWEATTAVIHLAVVLHDPAKVNSKPQSFLDVAVVNVKTPTWTIAKVIAGGPNLGTNTHNIATITLTAVDAANGNAAIEGLHILGGDADGNLNFDVTRATNLFHQSGETDSTGKVVFTLVAQSGSGAAGIEFLSGSYDDQSTTFTIDNH